MRTLSEILKEADRCTSPACLKILAKELVDGKKSLPLIEVTYGLEHILDIGLKMKAKMDLEAMFNE